MVFNKVNVCLEVAIKNIQFLFRKANRFKTDLITCEISSLDGDE